MYACMYVCMKAHQHFSEELFLLLVGQKLEQIFSELVALLLHALVVVDRRTHRLGVHLPPPATPIHTPIHIRTHTYIHTYIHICIYKYEGLYLSAIYLIYMNACIYVSMSVLFQISIGKYAYLSDKESYDWRCTCYI